jgi:hypothetical protein
MIYKQSYTWKLKAGKTRLDKKYLKPGHSSLETIKSVEDCDDEVYWLRNKQTDVYMKYEIPKLAQSFIFKFQWCLL